MMTSPFADDIRLKALLFQFALQLRQRERRSPAKDRALLRVGSTFRAYIDADGTDPEIFRLFYRTLEASDSSPEELRTCLERFVEVCPLDIELASEYMQLLLRYFANDRKLIIENGQRLLNNVMLIGLPLENDLRNMLQSYYTQSMLIIFRPSYL